MAYKGLDSQKTASKNTDKKRTELLGINYSTAKGRLQRLVLFSLVERLGIKCFHCKEDMTCDDFSIEHKVPWMQSDDPENKFFDLSNITFSHTICNIKDGAKQRKRELKPCGTKAAYDRGCRCQSCKDANAKKSREDYKKYNIKR